MTEEKKPGVKPKAPEKNKDGLAPGQAVDYDTWKRVELARKK